MAVVGDGPLVDDFFSTIEEVGLTDIAKEVGIALGDRGGGTDGGAFAAHWGAGDSAGLVADSQLSASNGGDSSHGIHSPPTVHMPQCSTVGPSVPVELQDMVASAGDGPASKKKRLARTAGGKSSDKGLRHFSMKVCEKVEQKVRTTYNEVADELVAEFAGSPDMSEMNEPGFGSDDKNRKSAGGEAGIRRRVYDALNVLMAMDIITKEKKNILWRGLPTNTEQEGARLQMDLNSRTERMDRKRQHLHDLVAQQVSFKQLISRNRASTDDQSLSKIALPFIVVNTRKETVIDCEMAEDRQEIFFNFSAPFEIHDDSETLKRMHMQRCPAEQIGALLPPDIAPYAAKLMLNSAAEVASPPGGGPRMAHAWR
jgi:hypothetical protein